MTYAELAVNYAQMSRLRLLTSLRKIKQNKMGPINCAQLVVLSTQLAIRFSSNFLFPLQNPHQMHLKRQVLIV